MIFVNMFIIIGFYAVLLFALIVAEHLAVHTAEALTSWLTPKRAALSAAIAAGITAMCLAIGFGLGWIQFGTPYDNPGFDTSRPAVSKPPPKSGPPPKIKAKTTRATMDTAGDAHGKTLDKFEEDATKRARPGDTTAR